ncbi:aldo/keto reductase [Pseudohoeflea coraliihabitans]|uniref:Aldo/keto reductase n=1 Tax=Pseudohoeflea coraliihabitans TaxID=2860393 RepID=A0ABS6WMG2_9HYPH|nr:aldo/keto reductase [Pseudohoeflea sp. DP4N28-3]MBW3097162.1 aldo/keto reductase [Pseudohoeflea sp. DP4N28-3]
MEASSKRKFGRTDIEVTAMGFGTAPIGNQFRAVPEQDVRYVIQRAWASGLRYFDTAPMYGHGLSERRLGESLRAFPRDEYVLSSKVGRLLKPVPEGNLTSFFWVDMPPFEVVHDYSYDGIMRSFEDSMQRLGVSRLDMLFIHDIDTFSHGEELQKEHFRTAMDSGYKALESLRSQGVVKAIGVGCNEWQVCEAALRERDFDCFLLAGRYTLLEQDALDSFLPLCEERNVSVVLGGGFNSGILATGAVKGAHYNYSEAEPEILERVSKIEAVCAQHGVPLAAAALQFVLAHPAIATNIPGTRTKTHLDQNVDLINHSIPKDFWEQLQTEGLIRGDAPTPT